MRIAVEHNTRYAYDASAAYGIQVLRLTPADFLGQKTLRWAITSEPDCRLTETRDGFGNRLHLMTVHAPHQAIEIRVSGLVEVTDQNGVVQGLTETAPRRVFLRKTPLSALELGALDIEAQAGSNDRLAFLHDLMTRVRDRVDYLPGSTTAATTAADALAAAKGVCQDHAHIFIGACRSAGIPARYVTGYLLLDGQTQAEAHHAWAEAWVDGLGWVGFDAANRLCPNDRYVRLAMGLDAHSATPIRGSRRGGGSERLEVAVRVAQEMSQQ